MTMTKQKKRRTMLIKREFQVGFMVKLAALVVLGGLVSSIGLYVIAGMELEAYSYRSHKFAPETHEVLLLEIAVINGVAVVLVAAAGAWLALHSLHRVAGPLWRFEQVVKSIGEGNLDVRTELRQADELKDFSVGLGRMTESLAGRIGRLRDIHRKLVPLVKALELQTETVTALDELKKHVAEAELILEQFKIPSEGMRLQPETAHQERVQP